MQGLHSHALACTHMHSHLRKLLCDRNRQHAIFEATGKLTNKVEGQCKRSQVCLRKMSAADVIQRPWPRAKCFKIR